MILLIRNPFRLTMEDQMTYLTRSGCLFLLSDAALRLYILCLQHADQSVGLDTERLLNALHLSEHDVHLILKELMEANLLNDDQNGSYILPCHDLKDANIRDTENMDKEFYEKCIHSMFEGDPGSIHSAENRYEPWIHGAGLSVQTALQVLQHGHDTMPDGISFQLLDGYVMQIMAMKEKNRDTVAEFLKKEGAYWTGSLRVLGKLGKTRAPTQAEINLYRKWTEEWHLDDAKISQAIHLSTAAPDPSMKYIDGILRNRRAEKTEKPSAAETAEQSEKQAEKLEKIRLLAGAMGIHPDFSSRNTLKAYLSVYEDISARYPDDVIHLAAVECGKRNQSLSDMVHLLEEWKKQGLVTKEAIEASTGRKNAARLLIRELSEVFGKHITESEKNIETISRWICDYGMEHDLILEAAEKARHAERPVPYLNKILSQYHLDGIHSISQLNEVRENAKKEDRKSQKDVQPAHVTENMYEQRENLAPDSDAVPMFLQDILKAQKQNSEEN